MPQSPKELGIMSAAPNRSGTQYVTSLDGIVHSIRVSAPVVFGYADALVQWIPAEAGIAPVSPLHVGQIPENGSVVPLLTNQVFLPRTQVSGDAPTRRDHASTGKGFSGLHAGAHRQIA